MSRKTSGQGYFNAQTAAATEDLPRYPLPSHYSTLHHSTFEYLKPTDEQIRRMGMLRTAAAHYANALDQLLPDGPDKTYILRRVRETAMWVNVAVTRHTDGTPRDQLVGEPPHEVVDAQKT